MRKMLVSTVAVAAASALAVPAAAPAAGWNCSATALPGQPAGPSVAANVGAATCKAASAGLNLPALPIGLQAGVLSARTTLDGPAGQAAQQTPSATGEVANLAVLSLPDLPIALPTAQIPPTTISVPNPLPGQPAITLDITGALNALLPNGKLPTADIVRVAASSATASGQCVNGRPRLAGASKALGVSVLGQDLLVNQVVQQVVTLIGASSIDPSGIDLSKVTLPPPLNALPLATVQGLVQPVLDALPAIPIPATLAQVKLTPGSQSVQNGVLTQKGLGVLVSIAGQTLADLTLGQASVAQGDVGCGRATAAAQLACTTRKLALIDVLERKGYARLYGAADRKFVGKQVRIVSSWNGKTAAIATVAKDGTFQAKGKLPPRAIRRTNRARYQARIGDERSLRLKLFRRMLVTKMTSSDGKVTIAGRVVLPLGHPVQRITIKRRVSCTKTVVEKTLRPDASGRFSVTLDGPPSGQTAVYRLETSVRKNTRNAKLFPTFTLPRAVELRR